MPSQNRVPVKISDLPPEQDVTVAEIAEARDVVEAALQAFARDDVQSARRRDLARQLAGNVRGWTHTTRLRDFLNGVKR